MVTLTKHKGRIGVIIPSSFLNQHEFEKNRKYLVENTTISKICKLGDGVFYKVTAPSCILAISKGYNEGFSGFLDLQGCDRKHLQEFLISERYLQKCKDIGRGSLSFVLQPKSYEFIFKKCYAWEPLKEVAEDVATGISSGLDKAYIYSEETISDLGLECDLLKKIVIGGEIHRYLMTPKSTKKIVYASPQTNIDKFPAVRETLRQYKERLMRRREAANGKIPWFSLNWPRREKLFLKSKIFIRQTSPNIKATYDDQQWYCLKSIIIVQLPENSDIHYYYLLGLLNSKMMNFLYNDLVGEQSRIFPEVKPVQLFKLPIRKIDFDNSKDKANHDKIVELVNHIVELKKKLIDSGLPELKTTIKRQIEIIDKQIDQFVYKLYGLTEEEIKIVESEPH